MRTFMVLLILLIAACDRQETVQADPSERPASPPESGQASEATRKANVAVAERLNFADRSDYDDAERGFLAKIEDDAIRAADGRIVWNIADMAFLEGDAAAPDTVNPSLWRQSQLNARHGLFEVTEGVYQVRGYDLAVMSVIEGKTGWIIVDPLTATETADASLQLVNDTLGERPVSAVIYTHSHIDHFGGARGVISEDDIETRGVPVIAPIGFTENVVAENLLAGSHMGRRVSLMMGFALERNPTGHVGGGLGFAGTSEGSISIVLPTEEISGRGVRRVIDGVTFEFIDAAGTEAPAEFMFYLPEKRALCTAEVATATFHNVLTLRGAKARDALGWSQAIDYVLAEYGDRSDVVFASHHWPTWGPDKVERFLTSQRDIYRYVHDQTLRRANAGQTMVEIAEAIDEPEIQRDAFDTRDYYGTLNHNAKAVYQYYFGWWGGVPADYHRLPHEESAERYVAAMGGRDGVIRLGVAAYRDGDYRWAAELFNHVVFAEPDYERGRDWLAATYEQLGYQAESGTWRSYYLSGAHELRNGPPDGDSPIARSIEFVNAIPTIDLFNAMATRFDPEKLSRDPFAITFDFTDTDETVTVHVGESVVVPRMGPGEDVISTLTVARSDFDRLVTNDVGAARLLISGRLSISGDLLAPNAFFNALDEVNFWAPVVTP